MMQTCCSSIAIFLVRAELFCSSSSFCLPTPSNSSFAFSRCSWKVLFISSDWDNWVWSSRMADSAWKKKRFDNASFILIWPKFLHWAPMCQLQLDASPAFSSSHSQSWLPGRKRVQMIVHFSPIRGLPCSSPLANAAFAVAPPVK